MSIKFVTQHFAVYSCVQGGLVIINQRNCDRMESIDQGEGDEGQCVTHTKPHLITTTLLDTTGNEWCP